MKSPWKWVGGKRWLLQELASRIPNQVHSYCEPFTGGAALFWHLQEIGRLDAADVVLADTNERLVLAYQGLRDHPDLIMSWLDRWTLLNLQSPEDAFETVSSLWREGKLDANSTAGAARMLYLSRSSFNGLYRVNQQNGYNVAIGKDSKGNPHKVEIDLLDMHGWSKALQGVHIAQHQFGSRQESLFSSLATNPYPSPGTGTVMYFDPPYIDTFAGYGSDGFDLTAHEDLERLAREHVEGGSTVLLSNSNNPKTCELYQLDDPKGFWDSKLMFRRGSMNSDPTGRKRVGELLIFPKVSKGPGDCDACDNGGHCAVPGQYMSCKFCGRDRPDKEST